MTDTKHTPMTADEALAVMDGNSADWSKRLARYRSKADKAAARKGERDIHADRLCEWAEFEREKSLQARATFAALIAERDALRADAERYRWLRGQMFVKRNDATPDRYGLDRYLLSEGIDEEDDCRYIDAAIDAARAESGSHE